MRKSQICVLCYKSIGKFAYNVKPIDLPRVIKEDFIGKNFCFNCFINIEMYRNQLEETIEKVKKDL
jgi:hypothetical protein